MRCCFSRKATAQYASRVVLTPIPTAPLVLQAQHWRRPRAGQGRRGRGQRGRAGCPCLGRQGPRRRAQLHLCQAHRLGRRAGRRRHQLSCQEGQARLVGWRPAFANRPCSLRRGRLVRHRRRRSGGASSHDGGTLAGPGGQCLSPGSRAAHPGPIKSISSARIGSGGPLPLASFAPVAERRPAAVHQPPPMLALAAPYLRAFHLSQTIPRVGLMWHAL